MRLEGQIAALTADPAFNGGDYTSPPRKGHRSVRDGVGGVALLAGVVAPRTVEDDARPARRSSRTSRTGAARSSPSADANDLILQARTWQRHDVGATPGFDGDVEKALRSITVPFLYMPSETDLYFPVGDARYEAQFIPHVTLVPIPSLWGHPAGAGASPADRTFLNENVGRFLQ